MKMPKSIATWCLVIWFLLMGLSEFVAALKNPTFALIGGLLALGVAVFTFLGM